MQPGTWLYAIGFRLAHEVRESGEASASAPAGEGHWPFAVPYEDEQGMQADSIRLERPRLEECR